MLDEALSFALIADVTCGTLLGCSNPFATVSDVFTDTRKKVANSLFIALEGEAFDGHDFLRQAVENGAEIVCISRKKIDKLPEGVCAVAVDSTLRAYQLLASYYRKRFPELKVAALTGSCGKTSTKEALRAIFSKAYGREHVLATEGNTNNQIGVPQNLFRLTKEHKVAVIEMGTNHPGEISPLASTALPNGAMIVSIARCHLEFLKSLEGVAEEKSSIFAPLPDLAPVAIPYDCPAHEVLSAATSRLKVRSFGFDKNADYFVEYTGGNLSGSSFILTERASGKSAKILWGIHGRHQACNAAGAAALASGMGVDFETIVSGLADTVLPGMRMRVTEHDGVTWINDAYNANPDSMSASLDWLSDFASEENNLIVLGDMGELGENSDAGHEEVLLKASKLMKNSCIVAVGGKMKASVAKTGVKAVCFSSSEEAKKSIGELAKGRKYVFLKASRSTRLEILEEAEGK